MTDEVSPLRNGSSRIGEKLGKSIKFCRFSIEITTTAFRGHLISRFQRQLPLKGKPFGQHPPIYLSTLQNDQSARRERVRYMHGHVVRTGCLLTESYTVTPQTHRISANAHAPDRSLSGGWDLSGSAHVTAHRAGGGGLTEGRCFFYNRG